MDGDSQQDLGEEPAQHLASRIRTAGAWMVSGAAIPDYLRARHECGFLAALVVLSGDLRGGVGEEYKRRRRASEEVLGVALGRRRLGTARSGGLPSRTWWASLTAYRRGGTHPRYLPLRFCRFDLVGPRRGCGDGGGTIWVR